MKGEGKKSIVLTIAGSDPSAGAGIQADLKTFAAREVYGVCVVTAVTAQNTQGVQAVYPLPTAIVRQQLESVLSDLPPQAAKTGMLGNAEVIRLVTEAVRAQRLTKLVVDPVILAKDGTFLLESKAKSCLLTELIPLAFLVTPNLNEAEALTGMEIKNLSAMKQAAEIIHRSGAQKVLIKGGIFPSPQCSPPIHRGCSSPINWGTADRERGEVYDLYYDGKRTEYLEHAALPGGSWHGTGCTLSAAITAELAKGRTAWEAVQTGIAYTQAIIRQAMKLGQGCCLLDHSTNPANRRPSDRKITARSRYLPCRR